MCAESALMRCGHTSRTEVARQPLSSVALMVNLQVPGTRWVVAVLGDSCGTQCLKFSSNVWHMECVCARVHVCVIVASDAGVSKLSGGRRLAAEMTRAR